MKIVEDQLSEGREPDRIGYFSFTKKAANEAIFRATKKFQIERKELKWFRTLHSCAYQFLGMSPTDMIDQNDFREFYRETGIDLSHTILSKEVMVGEESSGLHLLDLYRVKNTSLEQEFRNSGMHIKGGLNRIQQIDKLFRIFKKKRGILDFTDMILKFIEINECPKLNTVIVDEVQDLKPIEWQMVQIMMNQAEKVYLAGDDDQAIYGWSGADVSKLIDLDCHLQVLNQSYRIPKRIFNKSDRLVSRIQKRIPKEWSPRNEEGMAAVAGFNNVDLKNGEWLLLARTNYYINNVADGLKKRGFYFEKNNSPSISDATLTAFRSWKALQNKEEIPHSDVKNMYQYIPSGKNGITRGMKNMPGAKEDVKYSYDILNKEWGLQVSINVSWDMALQKIPEEERIYMRQVISSGHDLDKKAKIRLSTIHGAKGGECQNVVVFSDISKRINDSLWTNRDDERRVFYVAMTRAKQNLFIIPSNSQYQFEEIFQ